jgi:RimJ/RimL family protein N-acetyltransferase
MASFWPLFDLTIRSPRLVLRPPRDEDFPALLDAIDAGIHDPATMPFTYPWTDVEPGSRRRGSVQHWWSQRANWNTDEWHLPFAVLDHGRPIGIQELFAKDFPVLREVSTGSWLSRPYQGRGYGKEMRAAVMDLAFEGLGAVLARSGAFIDNQASAAVSRALGYSENGRIRQAPRGQPKVMVNYELTRAAWSEHRSTFQPIEISGLDEARSMFGLGASSQ